jgi:hypothetical protein
MIKECEEEASFPEDFFRKNIKSVQLQRVALNPVS